MRYCDARRTQYGLDVSGASNLPELHAVLFATVALRRLKADVIGELPPKRREILLVKTPAAGGFKIDDDNSFWAQFDAPRLYDAP